MWQWLPWADGGCSRDAGRGAGSGAGGEDGSTMARWCRGVPVSSRVFTVLDLPAATAAEALELLATMTMDLSGDDRWVVPAGPAELRLSHPVRPAAPPISGGPLLRLEGRLVRRWVRIRVDAEVWVWCCHRSHLGLCSPPARSRPRWYLPAASAALRVLHGEITAWAAAA